MKWVKNKDVNGNTRFTLSDGDGNSVGLSILFFGPLNEKQKEMFNKEVDMPLLHNEFIRILNEKFVK